MPRTTMEQRIRTADEAMARRALDAFCDSCRTPLTCGQFDRCIGAAWNPKGSEHPAYPSLVASGLVGEGA